MNRFLLLLTCCFVACAPARQLEPFTERKPDPIRDSAAHRAPIEWWYLNGDLKTASGNKGFAAAIFQVYIPENAAYNLANLFPNAFYFGHYSIVDKTSGQFESVERSTLPRVNADVFVKDASASTERMDVRLGDWRVTRESDGVYTAKFSLNGRESIDLRMRPTRPEAIHGPGWSGTRETGRMYYYSATRLEVSGTLNGEAVSGLVWLDHQWGGGEVGDGSASITPRWDWMSLNLEDGRDLMIYRVRTSDGRIADQFASIVAADGSVTEERDFVMQPWGWWTSKATGGRYPVRWYVKLKDGTSLTLLPVVDAQEVEARATAGFNYYEGAIKAVGSTRGVGYMELTGYGSSGTNPLQNPFSFLDNQK
jgi:predicted secreted hydrolase